MIVLAVLGVLSVLLTLVLNLGAETSFATQLMAVTHEQDRAYYVAQSAVRAAVKFLPAESETAHTLQDAWALGLPPLGVDGFVVVVKISDEERYLNPNLLLNEDGTANEDRLKVFNRLLKLLGQREEVTSALLDWMDSDSNRRVPGGAEGGDYGDRPPKNTPLDSLVELRDIKNMPPELLRGHEVRGRQVPPLPELLSVHAEAEVNLNTASAVVIQALSSRFDESAAQEIVEQRNRRPFRRLDDVLDVPGITRDHLYDLKKFATVKSKTWRISVSVRTAQETQTPTLDLTAVVRTSGHGVQVLSWRLDEPQDVQSEFDETPSDARTPQELREVNVPQR